MTSFISTYSINPKNLTLKHKQVSDWESMIFENDGIFSDDCQYMAFDCNGVEVVIDFDLNVEAEISHSSGDYWTPPSTDVDYTKVDVTIKSLYVDEWEVELNSGLEKTLEKIVKSNL